ncbi:MAG TPA: hypothetical protein VLL27_03525 [Solirubrobacterales bacterium]|nr:hypothetical protein [Solirubrobacterales bacterium]
MRIQFRSGGPEETCACVTTRWAVSDRLAEASVRELARGLGLDSKSLNLDQFPDKKKALDWPERWVVRVLVGIVALGAILSVPLVPVPDKPPATALNEGTIYHLEVALLIFYGGLLLLTPAFWGLIRGRLPTEISSRGAKYPEEVGQSADVALKAVGEQANAAQEISDELVATRRQIKALAQAVGVSLPPPDTRATQKLDADESTS